VTNAATEKSSEQKVLFAIDRKWYALVVFIVAIAVYANTLTNGYVLDDMGVITQNTFVQKGFAGIPEILTTPSLRGFSERPVFDMAPSNDIYRPASLVMFAAEHQLLGGKPAVGHFFNVLLFGCCSLLLFFFIDMVLEYKNSAIVLAAALLFAVHPIHTEVVANIKSRDELLCFFFAFSAILLYHRYVMKGALSFLIAASLCYFLSLMSKESSISFVAIAPLFLFFYADGNRKRAVITILSLATAAAAYLFIRYYILSKYNANHSDLIDFMENPLVGAPGVASRIATALLVLGYYVWHLFVPLNLSCDYTFASIPFASFSDPAVWLSITIYVSLVGIAIYRLLTRQRDPYAFGILFFLLSIAIFSNLAFFTGALMADRFLFFPSVGFCLAIAVLSDKLLKGRGKNDLRLPALLLAIICFAGITIIRNTDWKDNYTLITTDSDKYPDNARLQHSRGYLLVTTQLPAAPTTDTRREIVIRSFDCYRRSLAIYPLQCKVHTDIANLFSQLGLYDSAEAHIRQALVLRPGDPVITSLLGGVYFAQGQYAKTLILCRASLQKAHNNTAVLNNMGICYLQMKLYDSAAYISKQVLQLEPGNKLAQTNLAVADSLSKTIAEPAK